MHALSNLNFPSIYRVGITVSILRMGKECGKGHQWPAGTCFCGGDVPPAMTAFPSLPHGASTAWYRVPASFTMAVS